MKKECTIQHRIIHSRRTQKEIRCHWEKDWRNDDSCSWGRETELHSRPPRTEQKKQVAEIRNQKV